MLDESQILDEYYRENGRKLHSRVDKILQNFGGIAEKDYDDFYSIANEVFVDVLKKYNYSQKFDSFLCVCLSNKIKTEITRRNRIKRLSEKNLLSLDAPVGEEGVSLSEQLISDFDMEAELCERGCLPGEEKIEKYFAGLSRLQRRILELKMNDISKKDILERLNITEKVYEKNFEQLRSYDKTSVLLEKSTAIIMEEEKQMAAQTSEISKNTSYSIAAYIKRLHKYSIRGDHPLQRNSNQWSNLQKYNLITTVLNRYPIPEIILAEQVKSDRTENWLIDGKQRLTNLSDYEAGMFKIGKNAERPVIHYQAALKDEEGNIVLDEGGSPQYENKEFDVRGKYYAELPEELKERFNDYTIPAVQYLSCSDDDIEYHIRRYNASKPMSAAQKGITHLGEQYAKAVKKLAQHEFFKEKGNFKISEFTNGTVDRVITESIMVIYFLYDWKKKQEDICAYLKENVKISQFDSFEHMLDRLAEVVNGEAAGMFHSKDAFLWFCLFDRFSGLGFEDERFVEFMLEFKNHLHCKKVKNKSYDDLCRQGTKDRASVIDKINVMEYLMNEYLHVKSEKMINEFIIRSSLLKKYVSEFGKADIVNVIGMKPDNDIVRTAFQTLMMICGQEDLSDSNIQKFILKKQCSGEEIEDTLLYLDCLGSWTLEVNNNSSIFRKDNLPVLVKLIGYVYENDMDENTAIEWFHKFVADFEADGGFTKNNQEKYNKMLNSLNRYSAYMKNKKNNRETD